MTAKILFILIGLCLAVQLTAYAQDQDSIKRRRKDQPQLAENGVVKDSARLAIEAMPGIAARRSAMLPGLGQIYNKRWWKVPLVYGGFVGLGLVFEFNQTKYQLFLKEAQFRSLNPGKTQNPTYAGYSTEGIIAIKDAYRRNRDLTILAGLGFYAIQVIDAYVDAKFYRFDVSDELALKLEPMVQPNAVYHASSAMPVVGLKLKLSLQ